MLFYYKYIKLLIIFHRLYLLIDIILTLLYYYMKKTGDLMEKIFVGLLVASLLLGGYSGKVAAYDGNSKNNINNIIVGSVKNQSLNTVNNFSSVQGIKKYNLDFSCLKVNMQNKKLVTQVDYEKIANVAKAKNFNSDKKIL